MRRHGPGARPFLLYWFLWIGLFSTVLHAPALEPLTNEEVVRAFVAGRSTAVILAEIEAREPQFDMAPEMLEELLVAGLPRELIDAMRRRQERHDDRHLPEPVDATLRIRLNPGTGSNALSIGTAVGFETAVAWELGNAPEDRRITAIAIYLACRTPEHVPDHWRLESALGRDTTAMPRHQILLFLEDSRGRTIAAEGDSRLRLEVPDQLELPIEPGVHDLSLGVALEVGGTYHRVLDATKDGVVVPKEGLELKAVLRKKKVGRAPPGLRIEFLGEEEQDDADEQGESAVEGLKGPDAPDED